MSDCRCSICKAMSGPWHARLEFLYPVTIVPSRYSGTYEGGQWLSFPVQVDDMIGSNWNASDVECSEFYIEHTHIPIGAGGTPQEAYEDMIKQFDSDEFTRWAQSVRRQQQAQD